MKRILIGALILVMIVTMISCSNTNEGNNNVQGEANNVSEVNNEVNENNEVNNNVDEDQNNNMDNTNDVNQSDDENDEAADTSGGVDLLSHIGLDRPDTMKIVSEITAYNSTIVMTTYYDGDKSRTEVDIPGMAKSIMIHIPNREVMYQYVYGESTGMKITGADAASAQEMGMMLDTSLLDEIKASSYPNMVVKNDFLDGEEVIYIETKEEDEEMGEMLVKMWYSIRYQTPLKYEMYVGEMLMSELNVTQISDNVNFNGDLFTPPEDVNFDEIDMETLMKNW